MHPDFQPVRRPVTKMPAYGFPLVFVAVASPLQMALECRGLGVPYVAEVDRIAPAQAGRRRGSWRGPNAGDDELSFQHRSAQRTNLQETVRPQRAGHGRAD